MYCCFVFLKGAIGQAQNELRNTRSKLEDLK